MTTLVRTEDARQQLIATLPVRERRLQLAGVSTAILEAGKGRPVVLLHGPAAYAAHWMGVIPALARTHRVIAPDLPGHGASEIADGRLDAERVLEWLGELMWSTCEAPPSLVGHLVGGAIAARFAVEHGVRVNRLVLVDTLGLAPFQLPPEFADALARFLQQPTAASHEGLWRHCAFDLEALRRRLGARWEPFAAYNVERARAESVKAAVQALIGAFGEAIPAEDLARIAVPTTLIWGRHDAATPLAVAQAASERYGWPLEIIENANDDPPVEQPEALLLALYAALESRAPRRRKRA